MYDEEKLVKQGSAVKLVLNQTYMVEHTEDDQVFAYRFKIQRRVLPQVHYVFAPTANKLEIPFIEEDTLRVDTIFWTQDGDGQRTQSLRLRISDNQIYIFPERSV